VEILNPNIEILNKLKSQSSNGRNVAAGAMVGVGNCFGAYAPRNDQRETRRESGRPG